jgi:hypothetical protein
MKEADYVVDRLFITVRKVMEERGKICRSDSNRKHRRLSQDAGTCLEKYAFLSRLLGAVGDLL